MMTPAEKLPISPLRQQPSLREGVTESLRTAIVAGDLVEGEIYSAPVLGTALGVSATPVREAMMDLAREGLVEAVKNKGFRITSMSDRELDEITEIRLLIEPPVICQLVGHLPQNGFTELRIHADRIVQAAADRDLAGYLAADRDFHARLLSFQGNRQLVELATSLRTRTRMYGLKSLNETDQLAGSAMEHHELLDLMERGDEGGSYELMRRHIGHARGLWAEGNQLSTVRPSEGSSQ
ncbi:DNA-binding GntR family transcriptional regulator [Arthrobacter sp. UYP6]|uniref:GntR family transcriptional regulator n=1 Tax=Arthrobacter sp. UYP6 TaxID=1756378 RepID=UPI0033924FA2